MDELLRPGRWLPSSPPTKKGSLEVAPRIAQSEIPDSAKMTIMRVESLGFTDHVFDFLYPVPDDMQRRVQIRNEEHYKPNATVTKIAEALKRDEAIEPIVMTRDGYTVDGNTRIRSAHRAGRQTLHAVVIQVDWGSASRTTQALLTTLGAGLNIRHGQGIDRSEIAKAVLTIGADKSFTATRIAAHLSVTEQTVNDILAEDRARRRAISAGVDINGSVNATQLRKLGRVADKMNLAPFGKLAQLAAVLTAAELSELITRVRGADSDEVALILLEEERLARVDQIREFIARGNKPRTSHPAQLRQKLGFILDLGYAPEEFVESSPNFAARHCSQLEHAIERLQLILALQLAATLSRT